MCNAGLRATKCATNWSPLAEASWEAFKPYLSRYQWAFDQPSHSPRKSEIIHAIRNKGKKGACTFYRAEGYKYILPVLNVRRFEDAVRRRRKLYYVSWGRYALLYFDIDLHYAWQTLAEGEAAKALIDALLTDFFGQSVVFWSTSSRGLNGYLKVDLQGTDYAKANGLFDRLQRALELFLADHQNLADFEIKGRVGFLGEEEYNWSQYGKLPIHGAGWNFATLETFTKTPTVPLRRLGALCEAVEAGIPADILIQHKAHKKALGDMPIVEDDCFLVTPAIEKALVDKHGDAWRYMFAVDSEDKEGRVWLGLQYYRPGETPVTEWELREQAAKVSREQPASLEDPVASVCHFGLPDYMQPDRVKPEGLYTPDPVNSAPSAVTIPVPSRKMPSRLHLDLDDLRTEPDSFARQRQALLRLARYLKRVPTEEEALAFIKDQRLFTGSWEENQSRRRVRIRSSLNFIARTFDPGKCSTGGAVNVGKYDAWAKTKFPKGIFGTVGGGMNQYGTIYQGTPVHVDPQFIAVFMAVAEYCLLIQSNDDLSLPHDWAEALWTALYTRGAVPMTFCARSWAVCRDMLERYGIVNIIDRSYRPGKAMKWAPGLYFPFLGLWKTKTQPSLLGPGILPVEKEQEQQEHNTWLRQQPTRQDILAGLALSRPPPRGSPFGIS